MKFFIHSLLLSVALIFTVLLVTRLVKPQKKSDIWTAPTSGDYKIWFDENGDFHAKKLSAEKT